MTSPQISSFLQERIDAGDFPSAVYLVAEKGRVVFHDALGYAVVQPQQIEARTDTIYDIASLTKPLVTGMLTAILIEHKSLSLDRSAPHYLPAEPGITASIQDLTTHRSGYPAWAPFYLLTKDPDRASLLDVIVLNFPPAPAPGVVYSDLNFIILSAVLEYCYGKKLETITSEKIIELLSLNDTSFDPKNHQRARIAASEKGNEFEKQTCVEQGYDVSGYPWRDYPIWGEVHDGNAWFMGGVSGHAGLFSTAEDVFQMALQFLPGYTSLLKPNTCQLFTTNFTPGLGEDRSLSFQLASTKDSTAGSHMSPQAFGHLGFTGTSLWIDPATERIFVLLTNRTHAHPLPFTNINSVRRTFHDIAGRLLDEQN